MKIEIKMDYNDVKVLRELATIGIVKKTHSTTRDEFAMAFKWDMTRQIFWIEVTNSYVLNIVEFGKNYYPKFIVDNAVRDDENIYCVAVSPKHLLQTTRQILKHKKTTVDDTCKLVLESAEVNVVRDFENTDHKKLYNLDTEYKTMDNLYFDFEFDDDEYLNLFKLPPRTQSQDRRMIENIDSVMDTFIKDLTSYTFKAKVYSGDYIVDTPDIIGINTDIMTQATKIMNMNNDKGNTSMGHVKNCLYFWKHSSADDNVKNKEAIVMERRQNSDDEKILGKYRTKAETVIG